MDRTRNLQVLSKSFIYCKKKNLFFTSFSLKNRHLVIVGSISYYSVKNFVDEFFHVDWKKQNLTLIFLNK